jgi:hypothetical protein
MGHPEIAESIHILALLTNDMGRYRLTITLMCCKGDDNVENEYRHYAFKTKDNP